MRRYSRDALRPRFARNFPPPKSRGRRECRMRAAPEVSCAVYPKKGAHEHTGAAENIRHSLRNGFTAYNALSPVSHVLLPPSTPTMGRQDHTSLPYASVPFAEALPRPSHPRPAFVAIASAPLVGTGCELYRLVCASGKANYF